MQCPLKLSIVLVKKKKFLIFIMFYVDHNDIFDHINCIEPDNLLNYKIACWNVNA